jgi:hypothetical protein
MSAAYALVFIVFAGLAFGTAIAVILAFAFGMLLAWIDDRRYAFPRFLIAILVHLTTTAVASLGAVVGLSYWLSS